MSKQITELLADFLFILDHVIQQWPTGDSIRRVLDIMQVGRNWCRGKVSGGTAYHSHDSITQQQPNAVQIFLIFVK